MSGEAGPRLRWTALAWALVACASLVLAMLSPNVCRPLVDAATRIRPLAVIVALPGQAAAALLCGGALFALRPGVSLRASIVARLLRDAGANLLIVMPGLGELIGARALVLAGGTARSAVTASAIDNVAEALAQIPFAVLAVFVLPPLPWTAGQWPIAITSAASWLVATLIFLLVVILLAMRAKGSVLDRLVARVGRELALVWADIRRHGRGFAAAFSLHVGAWAMGGVQLWMIAAALGLEVSLFHAIVIESIAYAARGIAFFVPAGLVIQESALVLGGLAYGLTPTQSLAIGLVLRLRDLVFGLALVAWPLLELGRKQNVEN